MDRARVAYLAAGRSQWLFVDMIELSKRKRTVVSQKGKARL